MAEVNATLSSMGQGTEIVYSREDLVAGVAGEVSNTDGLTEQVVEQVKKLEMMEVDTDSAAIVSTMEEVLAIGDKSHDTDTDNDRGSIESCKMVIAGLRKIFESDQSLKDNLKIMALSQDLNKLEKKLQFPKTIIAVVGDTGVGKSSLMNAILNYRNVLPTSGIRACTAVVVEVIHNTKNNNFEADIEFLKKEEWLEELKVLTQDLEAHSANKKDKNQEPDPKSDAYVSYCKLMAVYGHTGAFDVLSRIDSSDTVTNLLGTTEIVSCETHEVFRCKIEKYIETQETRSGGQYWPIVKHVRLRIPGCDVCSSGAALVDLPGIRDSNAARDKIASEYLKNCTALWIVSSIHRAIDDKTAKDLLGDYFKSQLFTDGLYGSIAFICTKTENLQPSEILKSLRLEDKTNPHQVKVKGLMQTKKELELGPSSCDTEIRELSNNKKLEAQKLKTVVSNLETETTESKKKLLNKYKLVLAAKESEISCIENQIKRNIDQKKMELEKYVGVEHRAIKAICAKARNDYIRREIRRDFKERLKETKRRAGMRNDDDKEEEDFVADHDGEDDGIGSSDKNLKIFCCSSTEYQKLNADPADDGPAQFQIGLCVKSSLRLI